MCWVPRSLHMRHFGEKNLFPWLPAGPGLRQLRDANGFAPKPEGLSVPGVGELPQALPSRCLSGVLGMRRGLLGACARAAAFYFPAPQPAPPSCWAVSRLGQSQHPAPEGTRDPLSPAPPVGPAGSAPGTAFGPLLAREGGKPGSVPRFKKPAVHQHDVHDINLDIHPAQHLVCVSSFTMV